MSKVYIVRGSQSYVNLFEALGHTVTSQINGAELIVFTGGADVTPALYGDKAHQYTGNDVERDRVEQKVFEVATERGIPMVGICRGGQFLNVMSGGRMYQHVTNHGIHGTHEIVDLFTGEHLQVTSTHHQMFLPSDEAIIVAVASLGGTREWFEGEVFKRDVSDTDYEVVFYEHTKALCFQPHPEFTGDDLQPMKDYFARLLNQYLGV